MEEFKRIECGLDEISNMNFFENSPFILVVNSEGIKYEVFINAINKSKKAYIFGSGAYNPDKIKPPIFHRYTWFKDLQDTTIFYNDPTLYLSNIRLGWAQGTKEKFYMFEIARVLNRILAKLNISKSNVTVYGSSGGGFTALGIASYIRARKAIVNNPQTNILNYYKSHVDKMIDVCYPGLSYEEVKSKYGLRTNVVEIFKKTKHIPSILYMQNISAEDDVSNQLITFLRDINELGDKSIINRIDIKIYSNEEQGHNPLDKEETIKILKKYSIKD